MYIMYLRKEWCFKTQSNEKYVSRYLNKLNFNRDFIFFKRNRKRSNYSIINNQVRKIKMKNNLLYKFDLRNWIDNNL